MNFKKSSKHIRQNRVRRWQAPLIVAVAAVLVGACSSSSKNSASGGGGVVNKGGNSSGDYVVGATLGLTGPLAEVSNGYRQGIAAYFDSVNKAGGINGHKVKFIPLDDSDDVTTGVANARQLVNSDHVSLMYYILSNIQAANASFLAQNQVVTLSQAVDSGILNPPQHLVFAGGVVEPDEAVPMLSFGESKLPHGAKGSKAAVIVGESAALQQLATQLGKGAKARGMTVTSSQVVPFSSTDLSSEADTFASQKPDIIYSGLITTQEASFVRALRQRGFTGPIVQYDGGSSYPLMKQLQDPRLYMLFSLSFGHNAGPQVGAMTAAATAAGTTASAYFFPQGYVQAYITAQGLKKCGYPCPGSSLANGLESLGSIDTGGLTFGPWNYSKTDHSGIQDVAFFSWSGAKGDAVQDGGNFKIPSN
ncbi:ABC transporter substrate-binding protein [Acidiferrimicrobium sp. IK]|uniref:ABC transporter substrate-binding protein n=1 Tax=Acidiferrimicrobium sp. IK TaxID=2871700 RepID=UPI0021CAEA82|nr:ABC transporter substrate-binding protein [Acidiferrimicrobium sp. IK]MCU4183832.1 ABC transporter substrate-binding protein [Acidiferrimicrobium sp. IK]